MALSGDIAFQPNRTGKPCLPVERWLAVLSQILSGNDRAHSSCHHPTLNERFPGNTGLIGIAAPVGLGSTDTLKPYLFTRLTMDWSVNIVKGDG